jgi:signal transduction histidine kinase
MSKNESNTIDLRIKKKVIGRKEFLITYGVVMLLSGLQTGIIVSPVFWKLQAFFQINIILIYWAIVALSFTVITNRQIRNHYDLPMRRLSEAAKKVAGGDFSVYAEPSHTPDNYDFIDVMFLDFNKMVQELGSIETLKNDFVSNVSHEIKTPLAIIRNYTTFLRSENLTQEMRDEYIESIVTATDKLTNLVTNVLKLSKLDNQEIETSAEPFNLCAQLSACVLEYESLWEEKNIELIADMEDKVVVTADENMLELVWKNLLSNAIKFTATGGKVSLTQISDADSVTVSVADTGCGMSSETMKHIFDKFYQGDTSHSGDGNGLGLALAYRAIEKQGGTLSVISELGKGSTFTATLPLKNK